MSESMAGVTFLAFGNGSPDVFSTFAAMNSNSGSLAVGELVGAAGFITTVVAGSMALVREFRVGKKTFVRDVGFFIVAASFSMAFLANGSLHLWECCTMIGFYFFYVVIVVAWHWYLGRRRKRRAREAAARGQYLAVANEELEVVEEDEDDEDAPAGERHHNATEDFGALERGSSPALASLDEEESDEDEHRGTHLAAEMTSNMRVTRPRGSRRHTITPIRPSLVGALEFRSVLSSLQKSRGSHSRPIHLRRYSDESTAIINEPDTAHYSDIVSSVVIDSAADDQIDMIGTGAQGRIRAVSMNDATDPQPIDPAPSNVAKIPDLGVVSATPTYPQDLELAIETSGSRSMATAVAVPSSPTLSVTPPPSRNGTSMDPSPMSSPKRRTYDDRLAPPESGFPGASLLRVQIPIDHDGTHDLSDDHPKRRSRPPRPPTLQIPTSRDSSHSRVISPITQFPTYTDSPVPMSSRGSKPPSPAAPDSIPSHDSLYDGNPLEYQEIPVKWWPYRFLPNPYTLVSTLFPTLSTWHDKSIWDKFVSVVSAPSIFLLAITLPVVESESQEDEVEEAILDERRLSMVRARSGTAPMLVPDSPSLEQEEPEWIRYRRATLSHDLTPHYSRPRGFSGHSTAAVAVAAENLHHHPHSVPIPAKQSPIGQREHPSHEPAVVSPRDWNRWLVSVQIFTAPLFVVLIAWANTEDHRPRLIARLVLYSLLGSLIVFGILVLTTTPSKPPKYRVLLCFLGFVVSIAWISTIANEVVGVLKAFGVILGISDAILGLTIFAVGNSLGDLVADITVARLGYPVMALSACFGGPMLNILLGIGVSGLYMTIKEANSKHANDPGQSIKYKPYQIEVSGTLIISAITLLVTLVGLLIAVPLNKWIMSRRIGWGLIILWSISTVVNLAVEISGVW
jgi:solute carrier family 24 (sodium/potassium/calcium exchanger), member 6